MDKPLPHDAQQNLLYLCSIYTQGYHENTSPGPSDPAEPVYTLQNLQDRLKSNASQNRDTHSSNHAPRSVQAPPTEDLQEKLSTEIIQERNFALRGSAWSVCTGNTHTLPAAFCKVFHICIIFINYCWVRSSVVYIWFITLHLVSLFFSHMWPFSLGHVSYSVPFILLKTIIVLFINLNET